jgi:hypothetical protein
MAVGEPDVPVVEVKITACVFRALVKVTPGPRLKVFPLIVRLWELVIASVHVQVPVRVPAAAAPETVMVFVLVKLSSVTASPDIGPTVHVELHVDPPELSDQEAPALQLPFAIPKQVPAPVPHPMA